MEFEDNEQQIERIMSLVSELIDCMDVNSMLDKEAKRSVGGLVARVASGLVTDEIRIVVWSKMKSGKAEAAGSNVTRIIP